MIDKTDLNNLLIEAISITTDEQALFLSKKMQEDAVISDTSDIASASLQKSSSHSPRRRLHGTMRPG